MQGQLVICLLLFVFAFPFSSCTEEAEAAELQAFGTWLLEHGAMMSAELGYDPNDRFKSISVTVMKDLGLNEPVIAIPQNLVINLEYVKEKTPLRELDIETEEEAFVLFLLREYFISSSPWGPFLKTLSTLDDHPAYWSNEELEKLPAEAIESVRDLHKQVDAMYAKWKPILDNQQLIFPLDATAPRFKWAFLSARRLARQVGKKGMAIIPVLSHMWRLPSGSESDVLLEGNNGKYVVDVTTKGYVTGDPFYGSFGTEKNSIQLLIIHGKYFASVPHDWRNFNMQTRVEDISPVANSITHSIKQKCVGCYSFNVTMTGPPTGLFRFCRLASLKVEDLDYVNDGFNKDKAISLDNEAEAMKCTLNTVNALLPAAKMTAEQVQEALENKESPFRLKAAAGLWRNLRMLINVQNYHITKVWDAIIQTGTLTGHPAGFLR